MRILGRNGNGCRGRAIGRHAAWTGGKGGVARTHRPRGESHRGAASGAAVDYLGLLDANPVLDPITGLPIAQTPFLDMLDAVLAQLDDPAVTEAGLAELTSNETWIQLMGAPIAAGASSTYLRTVLQTARACMNAAMRYS